MNITCACPYRAAINHPGSSEVYDTVQVSGLNGSILPGFYAGGPSPIVAARAGAPASHASQICVSWQP